MFGHLGLASFLVLGRLVGEEGWDFPRGVHLFLSSCSDIVVGNADIGGHSEPFPGWFGASRGAVTSECNDVALEASETTLYKLEHNCGRFLGRLEGPSIPDKTEVGRDAGAVDGGVEEACGTP